MKKTKNFVAIILVIVLTFACFSLSSIASTEKGDVDDDGIITNKDVLIIRKYLCNQPYGTFNVASLGDIYLDNVVDAKDVYWTRWKIANPDGTVPKPGETFASTSTGVRTSTTTTTTTTAYSGGSVPSSYADKLAVKLTVDGITNCTVGVNQAGYNPTDTKLGKLSQDDDDFGGLISNKVVYLVNTSTNMAVANFTSTSCYMFSHKRSNNCYAYVSDVDFSSYTTPGTYRLYAPFGYSPEFTIKENPYQSVTDELVKGLYYQRCGCDITADQGAGVFAHTACHVVADPTKLLHATSSQITAGAEVRIYDTYDSTKGKFVANTNSDGSVKFYAAADFAGGLHDAGDYGRYSTPAAQTASDLLYAYEMYPDAFTLDQVQDNPGENIPDVLDEARWEIKFLLNMQADYGGVYFKICTDQFASQLVSKPEVDYSFNRGGLRISHVTYASTAAAAGAFAEAYIVFKTIDPDFANECLAAAKKAYDWCQDTINSTSAEVNARKSQASSLDYVPDRTTSYDMTTSVSVVGGGDYSGKEWASDMWCMSSCLYRATKEAKYNTDAISRVGSATTSMVANDSGGFGTLAYILAKKDGTEVDQTVYDKCLSKFTTASTQRVKNSRNDVYNCAIDTDKYVWGSNNQLLNLIKPVMITDYIGQSDTIQTLKYNLSFMLGANGDSISFITGIGENCSNNIHHVQSWIFKSKNGNKSAAGLLAGGFTEDNSSIPGFYYNDDSGDAVGNEICIYWNSAAILVFAAIVDADII